MSFFITHYYLVEPTEHLLENVRGSLKDPVLAAWLSEKLLIPKSHLPEHDDTLDESNAVQIKLAYLSWLRVDLAWEPPGQFEALFGSSELSVELFDQWWILSEIEMESFQNLETRVENALPMIAPQSNPIVLKWLRRIGSNE